MVEKVLDGKDVTVFSKLSVDEANDFLDKRACGYDKADDGYKCRVCSGTIMQTTLYISIHDTIFKGVCAGGGSVRKVPYPYCPACDGEPKILRACIHCQELLLSRRGILTCFHRSR